MSQKLTEKYISVDIEASGPIPGEYSLLSVGACVVGDTSTTFYALIKPLNGHFIPRAMEVNGFSLEELKISGEDPAAAMVRYKSWLKSLCGEQYKPVFVGFNATFDWSFVNWYFVKFIGKNPFGISGLDIKAYYMGKTNCTWRETNKREVKRAYPVNLPHTHNALADAQEQAELFSKMMTRS
jgi:DNA polymerase III epsilon subunit-like protein